MTETAQARFFAALAALAEANGYEIVKEESFANTGRVALVRAGTFSEVVSFDYAFSTGHNVAELQRILDAVESVLKQEREETT